jgi:predicted DNA binding CopG/RHH family protein
MPKKYVRIRIMSGAGKNADQINISLPKDAATEIKRRASAMGLSTSRYCFMILQRHLREGAPLVLSEDQAPYSKQK